MENYSFSSGGVIGIIKDLMLSAQGYLAVYGIIYPPFFRSDAWGRSTALLYSGNDATHNFSTFFLPGHSSHTHGYNNLIKQHSPIWEAWDQDVHINISVLDSVAQEPSRSYEEFMNGFKVNFEMTNPYQSIGTEMSNLYIGGSADQYSKYLGHFAEFVYFDHKIPDVVRENIQKHLDRKYGRSRKTTTCSMPLADLPDGYNMYCDTLRNELTTESVLKKLKLTEILCVSVGYEDDPVHYPLRIRCPGLMKYLNYQVVII